MSGMSGSLNDISMMNGDGLNDIKNSPAGSQMGAGTPGAGPGSVPPPSTVDSGMPTDFQFHHGSV